LIVPPSWKATTVAAVCTFYTAGDAFEKLEYSATGVPVLAKGDVKPFGRIEHSGSRFYPEELAVRESYRFTEPGDILLTTRDLTQAADFLGLVAPVPTDRKYLINQGANVIRISDAVDPWFFIYWCNGPIYRAHVKGHFVGSTQIHLRKEDFLNAPLWLPPMREQKAIADLLRTLDDKIDLNTQMNKTSEELAGTALDILCANCARQKCRQGTFGDVADVIKEQVDPDSIPADTPYIGLEHIPKGRIALDSWGAASNVGSNKAQFRKGDILFGKLRPYFHKVGVSAIDGICSTDILVIRPKKPEWLAYALFHASSVEMVAHADACSRGTKMPRANWGDLSRFSIPIPRDELVNRFNRLALPLVQLVQASVRESKTVASLRDALVPKVVSGELRIKSVEDKIEAQA
jgi:type I restriction enzyme, S subunit